MARSIGRQSWCLVSCALLVLTSGCASWLPSHEEPKPPAPQGITPPIRSTDTAGIETILVRLDSEQSTHLSEVWEHVDEQALSPSLRVALDRNGMRAGKISSQMPLLLEQWIRQTVKRIEESPLEQAGYAADISSYSQLWRCRENVRKELTIRNFSEPQVRLTYHEGEVQERTLDAPHFLFSIQAAPLNNASAKIRLVPEIQFGELIKKVNPREAAIRMDSTRESLVFHQLAIDLRIQLGDYIVIGPTRDSRDLGEFFFHTRTQTDEIQPVLLVVRLSEANLDNEFATPKHRIATRR